MADSLQVAPQALQPVVRGATEVQAVASLAGPGQPADVDADTDTDEDADELGAALALERELELEQEELKRSKLPVLRMYGAGAGGSDASGKGKDKSRSKSARERIVELRGLLAAELERYDFLEEAEAATGVRKLDMVSYGGFLVWVSVMLGLGAKHWCELLVFCYPAQATMRALVTQDKAPVVRWLTYWLAVSFLHLMEAALGAWLLRVCPFYYPFKLGLVYWLQSPLKRGSLYVHAHILTPFLKRHGAVSSFPA